MSLKLPSIVEGIGNQRKETHEVFVFYPLHERERFLKDACSRVQVVAGQQQQPHQHLRADRKQQQTAGESSNSSSRKQEAAGEKRRRAVRPSGGPAEGLRRRGEADEVVWPSPLVQKESVGSVYHKMPRKPNICIVEVPVFGTFRDFAPHEVRHEFAVCDAFVFPNRH